MANINTASLILPVIILGFFSCSDVTGLSKEQIQENKTMIDGPGSKIINAENQPLYLLNDKVMSESFPKNAKVEYIDSIVVIKGETALQQFGKEGEYGVIKIYANPKIIDDLKNSLPL